MKQFFSRRCNFIPAQSGKCYDDYIGMVLLILDNILVAMVTAKYLS
jgi:hypothetical protein